MQNKDAAGKIANCMKVEAKKVKVTYFYILLCHSYTEYLQIFEQNGNYNPFPGAQINIKIFVLSCTFCF